ncbi:MAG TPA: hypothetical protein VLW65_10490 [Bryobacteraceae bacterium]|nr:hypothetical protein [Bryobacteraceae bacterium]
MRQQTKSEKIWQHRLKRLAENIATLGKKDEAVVAQAREIIALRRRAAAELHAICADFVDSLNQLLPEDVVHLDPVEFGSDNFREDGANLFQINVRGRILQVEFAATAELVSTEEFRVPYTLEGTVRAFNQRLLDKDLIEEQMLFYTVESHRRMWRFFDARTYRSGPFDRDYLLALMEQIV